MTTGHDTYTATTKCSMCPNQATQYRGFPSILPGFDQVDTPVCNDHKHLGNPPRWETEIEGAGYTRGGHSR